MKKLNLVEDYLIDSNGIKFEKILPLTTIEVRVSTANPSGTRIDTKKDFVDVIRKFPTANAFLDLGPIDSKYEEYNHSNQDIPTSAIIYNIHKVELYHIGE